MTYKVIHELEKENKLLIHERDGLREENQMIVSEFEREQAANTALRTELEQANMTADAAVRAVAATIERCAEVAKTFVPVERDDVICCIQCDIAEAIRALGEPKRQQPPQEAAEKP